MATYGATIDALQDAGILAFDARTTPMEAVSIFDWNAQLERFKKIAREFLALFDELKNLGAYATGALKSEYDDIMASGTVIRGHIENIAKTFDWGINNFLGGNSSNLGLAPLVFVPLALVVGLIAVIAGWTSKASQLRTRIKFIKEQQEKGATPEEIDKLLGSQDSGGIFGNITGLLTIGIVGYFLVKTFQK